MKTKLSVLKYINRIYKEVARNGMKTPIESSFTEELQFLSEYFKTDKTEAFFITIIFSIIFEKGYAADIRKIADVLKWNTIDVLEYNNIFEKLTDKDYFIKNAFRGHRRSVNVDYTFSLNKKITEKIIANEAFPDLNERKYELTVDLQ